MTNTDWHQRASEADLQVRNMIDGQSVDQSSPEHSSDSLISKYSPRDASLLYQFSVGTETEVNRAVASARAAFDDGRWQGLQLWQRQQVLNKLADLVEEHKERFAL